MKWYNGNIAEAVQRSKDEDAIFLVAIFGDDESSKKLEETLGADEIQTSISSKRFVSIRLTANSQEHLQFKQIYPEANAPCFYYISGMGPPIEVVQDGDISGTSLLEKFESAWTKHQKPAPRVAPAAQQEARASSVPKESTEGSAESAGAVAGSSGEQTDNQMTLEEKIERARQLAAAKAKLKVEEEAEEARRREKQRREDGKGVAELKRWQDEQETKRALEERKRQREEDKIYRKKLLEQIAKDRADRLANNNPSTSNQPEPGPSTLSTPSPPVNYTGKARLQFRLPNGSSQTHTFEKDVSLSYVRNFLITGQHVTLRRFSLCVGYPRREFSTVEYDQSLQDLGLIPSATLLVIPLESRAIGGNGLGGGAGIWGFLSAFLGYLLYPITLLMGAFQRALPAAPSSGSPPSAAADSSRQRPGENRLGGSGAGPSRSSGSLGGANGDRNVTKTDSEQSDLRKRNVDKKPEGNIHRLARTDSDSSDEDGTWNGNSTQQRPR